MPSNWLNIFLVMLTHRPQLFGELRNASRMQGSYQLSLWRPFVVSMQNLIHSFSVYKIGLCNSFENALK